MLFRSAEGKLKKLSLDDGTVVALCDAPGPRGASWSDGGSIVFAPVLTGGLSMVAAAGGAPKVLTELKQERGHRWPEVLPGGRQVLFTTTSGGEWDNAQIYVLEIATGQRKLLIDGGTYGRYSPSGHLIYAKGGALMAAPFDLATLRLTGPPVAVLKGIHEEPRAGVAQFGFSRNGVLVYLAGGMGQVRRTLVWVSRDGAEQPITVPPRPYLNPRLSPDGKRLAVTSEEITFELYLYEVANGSMSQFEIGRASCRERV